jgi:N-acetylmuramoyl-L-alanine amidase
VRKIEKLVVHCSDSQDSVDIGVKQIRRWHVEDNGWSDIGYHYVIRRDGRIERGRQDDTPGAHVRGHNSDSIGICVVGRTNFDTRQTQALYGLLRGLMEKYDLGVEDVWGHYELDDGKTCPNMEMTCIRAHTLFHMGYVDPEEI